MKLQFQLVTNDHEEIKLMDEFCKILVEQIKEEIISLMPIDRLKSKEKEILNATWIIWRKDKPKHINVINLVKFIVRNIRCKKRRGNRYLIEINPSILMPSSRNSIEQIARFLDKGNEISSGTAFLSRIFIKYEIMIERYWNAYVSLKLKRLRTSEVILIR